MTDKAWIIRIKKRLYLTACDISLIYMRKTRVPTIDPCGPPLDTHAGWENAFLRLTKNVLFMRSVRNQFTECLEQPIAYNFCCRMSSSVVSKAFCKSVKIMPVIKPWSKPFRILSFKNDKQKSVDRLLRKPDR